MSHHRYLIVGGGMAADAAVRGIQEVEPDARIAVLSEEDVPPYDRPPLSKGLWTGTEMDRVWRGTEELDGVQFLGSRTALRLEPEIKTVTDDRGVIYTYDRLLLATGGRPRELDDAVPQVIYFRTLADYHAARAVAERGGRVAVVGGGFIGAEMAAALVGAGADVTMIFQGATILDAVLPPDLSMRLTESYAARGVTILAGAEVASVRRSGDRLLVATGGAAAQTLRFDAVVAGLGIDPASGLAETAGIEVDEGIVVDSSLRTSEPEVFAAGDVAAVWSPTLGKRIRIEHEEGANTSGRLAGMAMAGAEVEYDPIPFFYSDLFDDSFEAIGEIDPELELHRIEAADPGGAIVYYTRLGRIRGILFWNLPGKARRSMDLLRAADRFGPGQLDELISLD